MPEQTDYADIPARVPETAPVLPDGSHAAIWELFRRMAGRGEKSARGDWQRMEAVLKEALKETADVRHVCQEAGATMKAKCLAAIKSVQLRDPDYAFGKGMKEALAKAAAGVEGIQP